MTDSRNGYTRRILFQTPLIDLLFRRETGRLDARAAIAAFELPAELERLTLRVARRTRLHRIERVTVAEDLAEHLREGLDDGRSPETLLGDFGDEAGAARLIRRSMIRKRSHLARTPRYVMKGSVLLSGSVVSICLLAWVVLGSRVWFDSPTITVDHLQRLNNRNISIPAKDRAWPGLSTVPAELDRLALTEGGDRATLLPKVTEAMSGNSSWALGSELVQRADLTAFYGQATPIIERVRELAGRPALGIELEAADDRSLISVELAYLSLMRGDLQALLMGDLMLAVRQDQPDRAVDDLRALLGLARLTQAHSFLICRLVALHVEAVTFRATRDILIHRPEFFGNEQLIELSRMLTAQEVCQSVDLEDERRSFEDIAQRVYGSNGQLLPEAFTLVRELGFAQVPEGIDSFAIAPFALAMTPSRSEALEIWDGYLDHQEARMTTPNFWEAPMLPLETARRYEAVIHTDYSKRGSNSILERYQKYASAFPLNEFMPAIDNVPNHVHELRMKRDATLVAIAIEQWRREHGRWPQHLEQLVPRHLEAVPSDQFDGLDLRYLARSEGPLIYSVGRDGLDEDGDPEKDFVLWDAAPAQE